MLAILLHGCSNTKQNLVIEQNDYEIDLTNLDSVRENLNGFWLLDIRKQHFETETILCLKFNNNTSSWEHIKYKNSFLSQKTIELTSCQSAATLIKPKDTVKIEFIGLGGSDTTKIQYLSKTKLSIDGMTYFKHKGFSELKNIME